MEEKNQIGIPAKYTLRKTGEEVEIVASNMPEYGARSEVDWVSYIDSNGAEHIKEHLNILFDFKASGGLADMFEKLMKPLEPVKLPEFDTWEIRRYELAKQFYVERNSIKDCIAWADLFINAMKKEEE